MVAIEAPGEAVRRHGTPKRIRVGNGSQFTAREIDLGAYANGVLMDDGRPGKPTDIVFIESFNARFRAECLNRHWFLELEDARRKVEDWRCDDNDARPHGAIGDRTPNAYIRALEARPGGSREPDALT